MTSTVAAVSQVQSLAAIRNFVRASVSCITYARGLCGDDSFESRCFLGMRLKHMIPASTEAVTISQWIEKGAFDALNKNYLKEMSLCVYNGKCTELLESYCFSFGYNKDGQRAHLTFASSQLAKTAPLSSEASSLQFPRQDIPIFLAPTVCKRRSSKQEVQQVLAALITKLVQVVESLPPLLGERVLTMRLTYYDEWTPANYEPPCFAPASERMVRFYREEHKYHVGLGSMDTSHHLFSVSIRHPLLAKVHAKLLRKHNKEATTEQSGGSGRTFESWLDDHTPGSIRTLAAPQGSLSAAIDENDFSELEKHTTLTLHAEQSDSRPRRGGASLLPSDVDHVVSVGELAMARHPLRTSEVACLVLATFFFTRTWPKCGGRGRMALSELQEFLRTTCPLDITVAAGVAMLDKLVQEGYLRKAEDLCVLTSSSFQPKPRSSGAALRGRLCKNKEVVEECNSNMDPLTKTAVKDLANTHWVMNQEPPLAMVQGLLSQSQVLQLLSTTEITALKRLAENNLPRLPQNKRQRLRNGNAIAVKYFRPECGDD